MIRDSGRVLAYAVVLVVTAAGGLARAGDTPGVTLLVAQAQFVDKPGPDGKAVPVPGPARLLLVKRTAAGWEQSVLEDPDSNVFHKAMPWDGGLLTIGATKARLKTWKQVDGKWQGETRWGPVFGGKFDRLRDVERGDVDGDGKEELVIATHDQGVIAIVHPDEAWRVEEIDRQPDTFVHEIEIGDVDGDGKPEIFATPSRPNKLDEQQPGEVRFYRRGADGKWQRGVVDAPGDTHAKEILTADLDKDGKAEVYVAWEGAIGAGGKLVKPVTIRAYRWQDGRFVGSDVASVDDRQMRSMAAGDVTGDGKMDLVASSLTAGVWLIERDGAGFKKSLIDATSSGFEHPITLADLDGDGKLEVVVAAEDQGELRVLRWRDGRFVSETISPLRKGDISWNVTAARP